MKKVKQFTPFQKNRLPDEGYWLDNRYPSVGHVYYCIRNGMVKMCRYWEPFVFQNYSVRWQDWGTLTWTCCPTRKQIELERSMFEHFTSHEDMLLAHPEFIGTPMEKKSPNDF